jgi:hypothetical protein
MPITESTLRGYLLEEALAWLLRNTGYRLLVHEDQDRDELEMAGNGLCVRGRGAVHQVDVLGEFAFPPAFSLPIRLFLEAKFTSRRVELATVRNAHGVIHDINENFSRGPGQRLRKRYRYVYALFSARGFSKEAEDFALAQQISLVDMSGASFDWLRTLIEETAGQLDRLQRSRRDTFRFPVNWMRDRLRARLRTMPEVAYDLPRPQTGVQWFADAALPILDHFTDSLRGRERTELLLGFPAAPFILPLTAENAEDFLAYVEDYPDHKIRLRRGRGLHAEWTAMPIDQDSAYGQDSAYDLFQERPRGYRLTFNLPEGLETWIAGHEEYRTSRVRAVKSQFLSAIVIYRMEGDILQTYQLQYAPADLRRV